MRKKLLTSILISACVYIIGCAGKSEKTAVGDFEISDAVISEDYISSSDVEDDSEIVDISDDTDNTLETDSSSQDEDMPADTQNVTEAGVYKFLDVFRVEYEMDVKEGVRANEYKPENFSYITTDATGKILTDNEEVSNFTDDDHTSQSIGYKGIIKYEDDKYTSRFGIDVSRHQEKIDWAKVKEAGVEFAIIRIGFRGYGSGGQLNEDKNYRQNIEGAKAAGLDVGVYFYAQAINEEEALEEAEFVLNLLAGEELDLPVVYDVEHVLKEEARTDNVSGEQFTKNVRTFCDEISDNGYSPMIYANMLWEAYELDLNVLSDIPVWYADYELLPQSPYNFTMWQYSQGGRISGIDRAVDLDVLFELKQK